MIDSAQADEITEEFVEETFDQDIGFMLLRVLETDAEETKGC
jgi:hypothetical protein